MKNIPIKTVIEILKQEELILVAGGTDEKAEGKVEEKKDEADAAACAGERFAGQVQEVLQRAKKNGEKAVKNVKSFAKGFFRKLNEK
jgi:hypothetical protein